MQKIINVVKLGGALAVLVLALGSGYSQSADAVGIEVECSGSGNLCTSISMEGVSVENGPNDDGTYYRSITFTEV